ncbi:MULTISPECIES: alpha/beta fold hydrolase [Streptomyces]|uniref:thioesterase II family protein n=1 Tax=Streptomyces TaxID=1883 RepID=UPI00068E5CC7|nr:MULTISPECIES: alpha/beta fold hydrolase [Streptomyces]RPK84167.1 Linear gramicidin dehydrogenase LgrE [Streptomyces sp. ADI98-10]
MPPRTGPPRWLARRRERPDAALRLYVFAHAGGSPGEYLLWSDQLPDLELHGVQLPGRGARLAEPAYDDLSRLVVDLVDQARFEAPYAFFGHSFGALVAYETARALQARGLPGPERLFLSSCPSPDTVDAGRSRLHTLPDDRFIAESEQRWGALPAQVRTDPRLRRIVVEPLRADIGIFETYTHRPGPRLTVPATLITGAAERGRLTTDGWAGHVGAITGEHELPGGHFHFRENPEPLLDLLRRTEPRPVTTPHTGAAPWST